MGRGDVKTAKGKRFRSSFGKSRPRKAGTNFTIPINEVKEPKLATITAKKAPAKKAAAKKTEEKAPVKKKAATTKPAAKKTEAKAETKEETKEK